MKFKALKWWQAVLIVFGIVGLAIGGVFLYQYLTEGFSGKVIYPEDISFVGKGEDENYPIFNDSLQRFEISEEEEFYFTITSPTEDATMTNIALSFDISFSGQGDNPWVDPETNITYISNGKIRVPKYVELNKQFEVEILTEGNFGGLSTIYAKSEKPQGETKSASIAIDVKAKEIELSAIDLSREDSDNAIDLTKNKIVEGTRVKFFTDFSPEISGFAFGDSNSPKTVFYSTSKAESLEFFYNDGDSYFIARGQIGSSATITAYAFANYKDQFKFYEEFKEYSGEALYNAAVSRLSSWALDDSKKGLVVSKEIELTVSQAEVNGFSANSTGKRELEINKLGEFFAGQSANGDSFGINITDEHGSLPSMYSNLAIAFGTVGQDKTLTQTDKVKVVGSNSTWERGGVSYTYILSNGIVNLNNAYWEVSSQTTGEYVARIILLTTTTNEAGQTITAPWQDEYIDIPFSFVANGNEAPIKWKNNAPIQMTIIHTGNTVSTESPRKLYENLDIPEPNTYKRSIYLATLEQDLMLDGSQASDYIDVLNNIRYNGKDYYEVSSDLLIKQAISAGLKVYFATVRTDAYGKIIPGADGTYNAGIYNIEQISGAIEVSAVDTLRDSDFNAIAEGAGIAADTQNNAYLIPTGRDNVVKLTFNNIDDEKNAALFIDEWKAGKIEIYAEVGGKEDRELFSVSGSPSRTGNIIEILLSTNKKDYGNVDQSLNILIDYNNTITTKQVGKITVKGNSALAVYTPRVKEIVLSLADEDNSTEITKGSSFTVNQSMNENGVPETSWGLAFVPTKLISNVKDQYGRLIEDQKVSYEIQGAPSGLVSIDAEGLISFGTGKAENAKVQAKIGDVSSFAFTLNINSVGITKYQIFDESAGYEKRESTPREVKAGEPLSTSMTGWNGNSVTLSEFIKLYSEDTKINDTAYKFTFTNAFLTSIAGEEAFLDQMLKINGGGASFTGGITSSTAITSIEVLNQFGTDLELLFTISNATAGAGGINATFSLTIKDNVARSIDSFAMEDSERKIYAQYAYDLGSTAEGFTVNLKRNSSGDAGLGGNLSWANTTLETLSIEAGNIATITNGRITFNEQYENSDECTFDIYNIYDDNGNGNPYGFSANITAPILMNLQVNVIKDFVDFATVASNGEGTPIGNYLSVQRIKGDTEISGVSYTLTDVPNSVIEANGTNLKRNENNNRLNLGYGIESRNFTVNITLKENEILSHEVLSQVLKLGYEDITIDNIAKENASYASSVMYNETNYLMLSVDGKAKEFQKVGTATTQTVMANPRSYTISDGKFTVSVQDMAFATGNSHYLNLEIKLSGDSSESAVLGEVRIPLLISSVGQSFASYGAGNNPEDLADLLNAQNGEQKLSIELTAGTETKILFDSLTGFTQGIIYDSDVATAELSIGKNYTDSNGKELASIDGNNLILKDLVLGNGEKAEIIINVKLTGKISQKVLEYKYRVMVIGNAQVETNYPYVDDVEYLTLASGESKEINLDETFTADNATQNIGANRFAIAGTTLEENLSYTEFVSSIEVDGIPQNVPAKVAGADESSVWTIQKDNNNVLTITITKDHKLTYTLHDASVGIRVGITRSWSNVVGGNADYFFYINAGAGKNTTYSMKFEGDGFKVQDNTWTVEPQEGEEQLLTATTKWHSGSQSGAVDVNSVKTNVSMSLNGETITTSETEGIVLGIVSDGTDKIEIRYDYKRSQVSVKVLEYLDKDYTITLNFSRDTAIGSLTIKVAGSIKVEKAGEDLLGGTTYGLSDIIGTVERYERTNGTALDMLKLDSETTSLKGLRVDTTSDPQYKGYTKYTGAKTLYVKGDEASGYIFYTSEVKTYPLAEDETYNANATYIKVLFSGEEGKDTAVYRYIPTAACEYFEEKANGIIVGKVRLKADTFSFAEDSSWGWTDVEVEEDSITANINSTTSEKPFLSVNGAQVQVAHLYKEETANMSFILNFAGGKTYTFTRDITFKENLKYANNTSLAIVDKNISKDAYTYINTEIFGEETLYIEASEYLLDEKSVNLLAEGETEPTTTIESFALVGTNVGWLIDQKTAKLTFTAQNVSKITPQNETLKIKYTFGEYSYTFYLNVNITISPSYTGTANYPVIGSGEDLGYETLAYTDASKGYAIPDIKNFFVAGSADLATGNRVVFTSTNGAGINLGESNSNITVKIESLTDAEVYIGETEKNIGDELTGGITLKPIAGGETPKVVLTITYNKMPQDYVIYLMAGDSNSPIGMTLNSTINTAEENHQLVETLYMNAQADNFIFEANRLAKLVVRDTSSLVAGNVYVVKANVKKENEPIKEVQASFQLKADQIDIDKVLYIDMGISCDGIVGVFNEKGTMPISGFAFEKLTQRAIFTYLTIDGKQEISNNKIIGKVNGTTEFKNFELTETNVGASETLTLSDSIGRARVDYTYKVNLDVEVGIQAQFGTMIEIGAHDRSSYRLIDKARITRPSTGAFMTEQDFANAGITTEISVLSANELEEWEKDTTIWGENKTFFDTTLYTENKDIYESTKEKLNNVRFLSWTEIKQDNGKAWDYFLFGEGAANYGSIVILKYKYTAAGITSTFYIPVKIKPDYVISVNGTYIVSEPSYGEATNINNPAVAEVDADKEQYDIRIANGTSPTGDFATKNVLRIINSNWNNNDVAYTWTYSITEDDGNGIYNNNLNKVNTEKEKYGFDTGTSDKGKTTLIRDEAKNSNEPVHLTRKGLVQFGTKTFKVVVSNKYGYKIDFYFIIQAQNSENPDISSTSTGSFKEGDQFDIGVIYKSLVAQPTDTTDVKGEKKDETFTEEGKQTVNIAGLDSRELLKYNGGTYVAGLDASDVAIKDDKDVNQVYKVYNNEALKLTGTGNVVIIYKQGGDDKLDNYKIAKVSGTADKGWLTLSSEQNSVPKGTYEVLDTSKYAVIDINGILYLVPLAGINSVKVGTITTDNKVVILGDAKLTALGTKYQILPSDGTPKWDDADNSNKPGKIVNLTGINAWGYNAGSVGNGYFPSLNANRLQNTGDAKYIDETQNTLQYLSVKSVKFLQGENEVGNILNLAGRKLKTADNTVIKWHDGSSKSNTNGYLFAPDVDDLLTIPVLDGETFKDGDSASITMRIELQYEKGEDPNKVIESCFVDYKINVSRKLQLNMDNDMVVVDGEKFELLGNKINASFDNALNSDQIKFYDDTLVITLPKKSSVQVDVLLTRTGNEGSIKKSFKQFNYSEYDETSYHSLSKLMDIVIKPDDTISIAFSGYSTETVLNTDTYAGFYAKIGNEHTHGNSDLGEFTWSSITGLPTITHDQINIPQSGVWPSGNKYTTVKKNYVVKLAGTVAGNDSDKYYVYERNYRVVPAFYDLEMNLGAATSKTVDADSGIGSSDSDRQYTVEFDTWVNSGTPFTWYTGTTTTSGGAVVRGKSYSIGDKESDDFTLAKVRDKLRFTIGDPNDPTSLGTATIADDGTITTRAGYKAGGNEYILVNIYVKAAGADGSFGAESTYDYCIGTLRLFVKESTTTRTLNLIQSDTPAVGATLDFADGKYNSDKYFQELKTGGYIKTSDIIVEKKEEDGKTTITYTAKADAKLYKALKVSGAAPTGPLSFTNEGYQPSEYFQELSTGGYIKTSDIVMEEITGDDGKTTTVYKAKTDAKLYVIDQGSSSAS